MIKKVDILGIQLDNYTVREAIMQVETYLSNNVLNTVESISMQMLIDSENDSILREIISSLDLAVIGEKEIIKAAGLGTMQRIRETEENDFFFEFLKRIVRNKKRVFLLADTDIRKEEMQEMLLQEFPKLELAGAYAIENCVGNLEGVINDMNALTPDVILSILPSPLQEHFFMDHKDKMSANIWYGIGNLAVHKEKNKFAIRVKSMIHLVKLRGSINKYRVKNEECEK